MKTPIMKDIFDNKEDYDFPEYDVECKLCGKANLHWEMFDIYWKLVDKHQEVHRCPKKKSIDLSDKDLVI